LYIILSEAKLLNTNYRSTTLHMMWRFVYDLMILG